MSRFRRCACLPNVSKYWIVMTDESLNVKGWLSYNFIQKFILHIDFYALLIRWGNSHGSSDLNQRFCTACTISGRVKRRGPLTPTLENLAKIRLIGAKICPWLGKNLVDNGICRAAPPQDFSSISLFRNCCWFDLTADTRFFKKLVYNVNKTKRKATLFCVAEIRRSSDDWMFQTSNKTTRQK